MYLLVSLHFLQKTPGILKTRGVLLYANICGSWRKTNYYIDGLLIVGILIWEVVLCPELLTLALLGDISNFNYAGTIHSDNQFIQDSSVLAGVSELGDLQKVPGLSMRVGGTIQLPVLCWDAPNLDAVIL